MTELKTTETTPQDTVPTVKVFAWAPFRLHLITLLLVVSAVAWRKGAYFSGGLDIVVMAKAALTMVAFVIALLTPRAPGAWARYRAAPILWLTAYLSIATIGGMLNGDGLPSFVLAGRLGLLALTLLLLVLNYPWQTVMGTTAMSMLILAGFGSATGVASLAETGRLYGGIPPLNANEICLLVSVPVVLTFWRFVNAKLAWYELAALPAMLGIIWLTGARTGLAALIMALMVIVMMAPRVQGPVFGALALALPATFYVTFFTPLLADFAGRGDLASVTTLNSRTVAWSAAIHYAETPVEKLFGGGLALKRIPVSAMYRSEQIFDSTWVSALVQSGYLGGAVLLLFVLTSLFKAFSVLPPQRSLAVALLGMVTIVSILESGMFDTTPAFIVFFLLTMFVHQAPLPEEKT